MLEENPSAIDLKVLLIVPYMKLGEFEKARKLFEDIKQNDFWYAYSKKEIFDQFLTEREKELCGI
jgi:hypothetical protein